MRAVSKRTITTQRGSGATDPVWQVPSHLVGLRCVLCGFRFRDGDTHGETDHTNWGELTCRTRKVEVDGMDIGGAIRAAKDGKKVARAGWNGKGMWIAYSPGSPGLTPDQFWSPANKAHAEAQDGLVPVLPCLTMKTATGEILMGWLASQTDLLATDWEIVP